MGAVAGPMLSNEDLWELRQLVEQVGSQHLGVYPATMSGWEVVQQVGVARGSNFSDMGADTTVLVIASDLEEEAPIWWLRTKSAVERGATLITLNTRDTRLDHIYNEKKPLNRYALRYAYGQAVEAVNYLVAKLLEGNSLDAALESRATRLADLRQQSKAGAARPDYDARLERLATCENLVVIVGAEGLSLDQHADLMRAVGNLLVVTGHVGRPNNGLTPVGW
ncbi:MAG: hypothetical protein HC915_20985, partial [Anaerolineae bacterium]|nr:hypothetical protein [Anaerolineae bacterium]